MHSVKANGGGSCLAPVMSTLKSFMTRAVIVVRYANDHGPAAAEWGHETRCTRNRDAADNPQ